MKTYLLTLVGLITMIASLSAATVEDKEADSAKMKRKIKVTVITPASYATGTEKFPVVYLLHGHGDNNRTWVEKVPEIEKMADDNNLILVCPNAQDSWYFDSLDPEFQFETFTSKELVDWVDSQYRTIANRTGRAIAGVSMGGHGAWYLALRHPDTFGAIGSMGGGLDIRPGHTPDFIVGCITRMGTDKDPAIFEKITVINMLGNLKNGDFFIHMDVGDSDFFAACNRIVHDQLISQGVQHTYIERVGAHQWEYWRFECERMLHSFSLWFKRNQAPAIPTR